jgi:glycosidase
LNIILRVLMPSPRYPSLYQINTRVWLTDLSRSLGRPATLDDIPDAELDQLARKGFDWIWFLSVWQTGAAAQRVSRTNPGWRHEFEETLPDLRDEDIPGSGFAITGYTVHKALGGDAALARLRARMKQRGLKLMLDFVPNHMAPDHPWVEDHPDYFIPGTDADLVREPQNYIRIRRQRGHQVFAYGRDPYFDGWPDTLQLNYANPALQDAMIGELVRIGGQCDGVRCDMAMLVLPEVFERTWHRRPDLFWPKATQRVRHRFPDFVFMAEVYWDLEWALQQQGFQYAYDKRLYDRLREGHVRAIREHFYAGLDFQDRLARFLENHDEPRAAATFPPGQHEAAAVITFLSPGLRFFHGGQFEGRLKRISPHLGRAPNEPTNAAIQAFYEKLLALLRHPVLRDGQWQLLECASAWDGNGSNDSYVAFGWEKPDKGRLLVVVNYAPHPSQCYLRLPFGDLANRSWRLQDQLSSAVYDRDGGDLSSRGLYLDMPAWGFAAYELNRR